MTDVTTRSRKSRSWLTISTVPGYSASRSCNRSRVSRSRSLVGSSSTRRLDGRAKARARVSLARSPPDSTPTGVRAGLLGAEQEILHVADHMAALAADCHGVAAAAGKHLA